MSDLNKKKKIEVNVRRRILVPLTLTFFVLVSSFIYGGYSIKSKQVFNQVHHKYSGVQSLFNEYLDSQAELMRLGAMLLVREKTLQEAFLAGRRDQLQEIAEPYLFQMSQRYGITHMYFHDVSGYNFLRVHQPDRFGDFIDRHVNQLSMSTANVAHGLELGALGTFSYRTVVPWFLEGALIGYIELGQEIHHILNKIKGITGVDYLIVIDKELLSQPLWETGMKMLGRSHDWNLLPHQVISDQSIRNIPSFVSKFNRKKSQENLDTAFEIKANKRIFHAKGFPLNDSAARVVGDFIIMHDATAENYSFRDFLIRISLTSLILCSALFAFAYMTLGRVSKRLSATSEQLHDQVDKAREANSKLEFEVVARKKTELQLKRLNESLEERVRYRTAELQDLNCELEWANSDLKAKHATILHQDKMASIGQLAAGVAHDINNPIGFVTNNLHELEDYFRDLCQFLGFQEHVLKQVDGGHEMMVWLREMRQNMQIDTLTKDVNGIIHESLEGTERVSKIVQNLRTFSRIDDDDFEDANLKDCLESTINITWNELRYKAKVIRNYGDIPILSCYPGQLNQVFMNLLLNAAQAIEGYGQIDVCTWSDETSIFISIADTGSGIPADHLQRIFEPFFTTKEVGKGTGLGLSITYDIVKRHGGDISAESELGKGTKFTIKLPIEGPHDLRRNA